MQYSIYQRSLVYANFLISQYLSLFDATLVFSIFYVLVSLSQFLAFSLFSFSLFLFPYFFLSNFSRNFSRRTWSWLLTSSIVSPCSARIALLKSQSPRGSEAPSGRPAWSNAAMNAARS